MNRAKGLAGPHLKGGDTWQVGNPKIFRDLLIYFREEGGSVWGGGAEGESVRTQSRCRAE